MITTGTLRKSESTYEKWTLDNRISSYKWHNKDSMRNQIIMIKTVGEWHPILSKIGKVNKPKDKVSNIPYTSSKHLRFVIANHLFFLPEVYFFPSRRFIFSFALTPYCSIRGGEWHEPRLLPGILAQKDPHKQDTTRVLFSLYANMQQGKCKYFGYGFLRNKYPTARNKYPKGYN